MITSMKKLSFLGFFLLFFVNFCFGFIIEIKLKNPWEISAALAFQGNIGDNLIIYAGPYLFWSKFDIDGGGSWEAKNNFGGMGGVRFKFGKNFSIEIEGQYTDEFSAGGVFTVSF